MSSNNKNQTQVYLNMCSSDLFYKDKSDIEKHMLLYTLRWIKDSLSNYSAINEIPQERQDDYASYNYNDWKAYKKAIEQSIVNTPWVKMTNITEAMSIKISITSGEINLARLIYFLKVACDEDYNAVYIHNVLSSIVEREGPDCNALNKFLESSCQQSNNPEKSMKGNMSMLFTSRIQSERAPKYVFLTMAKKDKLLFIQEWTFVLLIDKWEENASKIIERYEKDFRKIMEIDT